MSSYAVDPDQIVRGDVPIENAEELVARLRQRRHPDLEAASRRTVNQEKTANLDIDALAEQTDRDVVSAAVRGDHIVYVYEDERGDLRKDFVPFGDAEPVTTETRQTATERAIANARVTEIDTARAQEAEIQRRVAEAAQQIREEVSAGFASELAKLREELSGSIEKAGEDAEKAQQSQADRPKGKSQVVGADTETDVKGGGTARTQAADKQGGGEAKGGDAPK
jgi:hypothetical protein